MEAAWRNEAANMQLQAIESDHFLPEENAQETLSALNAFFVDSRGDGPNDG
jgi:surfactin synthase thioesterase subunit